MGSLSSAPTTSQLLNRQIFAAFRLRDHAPPRTKTSISISSYSLSNNTWSQVTSIPGLTKDHGLKDFAMVSLRHSIFIIGGLTFDPDGGDVLVRSSVLRYDLRSGAWTSCAAMTTPRYDFACAVCDGKIFVAGGKSELTSADGESSAEVYDPAADVWTPLPDMSTMRYKCAGVTWNGKIHVVGGFALKAGREGDARAAVSFSPERSSAEVYDSGAGRWGVVAGMWQLDVPPNQIVAVDDGRLLSSGDCLKVWKGHVEAYDWRQNMWNELEGSNNDIDMTSQLYLTIAPIATYLYFMSGYKVEGQTPKTRSIVHRFDTSATTNAWTIFDPTEEEGERVLCSHCCVAQCFSTTNA